MSTQPVPQPDAGQFQYVKLPDGSYGKFAANATDDVIKGAISKDFPDAFAAKPAQQDKSLTDLMGNGMPTQEDMNPTAEQHPVVASALSRVGQIVKGALSTFAPSQGKAETASMLLGPIGPPLARLVSGQVQAEKQLAPQLQKQVTVARTAHASQPPVTVADFFANPVEAANRSIGLEDVRAGNTALAMVNPFASGSVANVNQLQDEGKPQQATGEGITDALMLGAGLPGPQKLISGAARDVVKAGKGVATTARNAGPGLMRAADVATDALANTLNAGGEFLSNPQSIGKVGTALGRKARQMFTPPEPPRAVGQPPETPIATFTDVPDLRVQPGQQPPENLLSKPATVPVQPQSQGGEFQVIPPEPADSLFPQAGTIDPFAVQESAPQAPIDPRGAFAKYAQGQDLGGLADPLTANNPSPITNPIKPQSSLPAWANELMGWEQSDPQHLFNQMDEHDFLNHQRQEEIQQWIAQHNKAPEPFAGKGLKTSEQQPAQRTLGQPPAQEAAPQPQVEVATEENMQRKLQESLDRQAAKKATRTIGQPPGSQTVSLVNTTNPRYAYRLRNIGEEGITPDGQHAQASMSEDEIRRPGFVEGRSSSPQEIVRFDLNKLKPEDFTASPGPNGADWVQLHSNVPESALAKMAPIGSEPARAIGQPPVSSKIGGAKILAGDIPLKGPVSPVEADISRLNAELKAATDPTEIADIKQALEHAQARMEGRPYTPPEQAEAENLPLSQPRTYQPPPYTRGQAPEGQTGAGLTPENPVPASSIQPGGSGTVKTSELNLDPKRFQYKTNTDQSGTTNQFKDTDTFNRNLAGVVSTWTDPADGKTYVVNGHHRVELAQRTGEPTMLMRHLEASSPESARAQGALINIAEGRGTAMDAAKFFRDSTISPADLAKEGISLSEAKVQDGIALSKLDPSIFDKVATGQMTEQRGIAIGNATSDPVQQHGIIELIEKQEAKGRKVTNDTVAELSRFVANSGNKTIEQGGLFGANQEIQSLALDKAELSSYVKQQLSKEKRIFGAVADQGKAQILSRVKDQSIQPAENAQISQQAAQAMEAYDKLSVTKGPIDDILESVAKDRADGKLKPEEARNRAYEGIRTELQKTLGSGEDGSGAGSKTRPGFPAPPKR